jgi:hypothetical protein
MPDRQCRRSSSQEGARGGIGIVEDDRSFDLGVDLHGQMVSGKDLLKLPGHGQGEHSALFHALERLGREERKERPEY